MQFEYYNPTDESRSCVLRTMTKLTGKPCPAVKAELSALAEQLGFATYNEQAVFEQYMAQHGILPMQDHTGKTVQELSLPGGAYCVFCTNDADFYHLLPVIDGVIYDRRDDCRALSVLAVYRKEQT